MAYDTADGYTVLFGGSGSGGALGDTWIFTGGQWQQLSPATSPPSRYGAVMAYDAADGYVVLFGGYDAIGNLLGDTWTFKGGQWTQLNPATSPSPRTYAAMSYDSDDGYVVLFGGAGTGLNVYYRDTWTFKAGQWSQASPSVSPSPRGGAGLADDQADGYVVLFGGSSNYHSSAAGLDDTWSFAAGQWHELSPQRAPIDRYTFSFAYDPATQSVLLFGGWNPYGAMGANVGDTWQFSAGSWTKISSSPSPAARQGAAMAYDPGAGGVLLFGGVGGVVGSPVAYADTWIYGPGSSPLRPPVVSLKAKPTSVKVGKTVIFSGLVKHFLATDMTVRIERQVGGTLTALKTLPLSTSGVFKWTMKPHRAGKWVFVAVYKVRKVMYLSKPVTVKVHT